MTGAQPGSHPTSGPPSCRSPRTALPPTLRDAHRSHLLLGPNLQYRDQKTPPPAPSSACAALVVTDRITWSPCAGQRGRLLRNAQLGKPYEMQSGRVLTGYTAHPLKEKYGT